MVICWTREAGRRAPGPSGQMVTIRPPRAHGRHREAGVGRYTPGPHRSTRTVRGFYRTSQDRKREGVADPKICNVWRLFRTFPRTGFGATQGVHRREIRGKWTGWRDVLGETFCGRSTHDFARRRVVICRTREVGWRPPGPSGKTATVCPPTTHVRYRAPRVGRYTPGSNGSINAARRA